MCTIVFVSFSNVSATFLANASHTIKNWDGGVMMNNILFLCALGPALWGIVSSIFMVSFLTERKIPINFIFLKLYLFKYVSQYREITLRETGRVGPWFYSFIISMNLALVLVIAGILIR